MQQKRIFIRLIYGENGIINNNLEVDAEKHGNVPMFIIYQKKKFDNSFVL
jgi:hypothetical protein